MTRYDEYQNRLHRIVLHSADVLPEKVGTHLSELAKSRNYDTKKDVISKILDFKPLADSIPRELVDFVISVLIKKPINPENHPSIPRRITSSPETVRSLIFNQQDLIKPYRAYNLGDAIDLGIFISHRAFGHFMIYGIPVP